MTDISTFQQNAGHKHTIKAADQSSEEMAKLKCLQLTIQIKLNMQGFCNRLHSGNTCYYSVQNLFIHPSKAGVGVPQDYSFTCHIVWV